MAQRLAMCPVAVYSSGKHITVRIEAAHREALVAVLPVLLKIQPVLDEHGAGVGVIADAIAANPRIAEGNRQEEQDDQDLFVFVRLPQAKRSFLLAFQFGSICESSALVTRLKTLDSNRRSIDRRSGGAGVQSVLLAKYRDERKRRKRKPRIHQCERQA